MTTWFSVADAPPPRGIVVAVLWDGRALEVARVKHPRTGKPAWLANDQGRAVFLPLADCKPADPSKPWVGWHTLSTSPEFWRPLDLAAWSRPLPAPAYVATPSQSVGKSHNSAPAKLSADAARLSGLSAAELGRELEEMREAARARPDEAEAADDPQWWLEPGAVTYSPPGAITMREAEGRLMRAFLAERWVREDGPAFKLSAALLLGVSAEIVYRQPATGRDLDDMLEALGWLRGLSVLSAPRDAQTVLRLRGCTPPHRWRSIAKLVHRSSTGARELHRQAIAEVTAAANNGITAEIVQVRRDRNSQRERLAELKRSTRAAKKRAPA